MGNPKAFLTIHRQEAGYRPVHERINDFSEVEQTLNSSDRKRQASRCMDCGVPFCHWACPLGNRQPEWQDYLSKGRWREAYHVLQQTCDFPEFTGRICPALCEQSCVLKLSCGEPVTIRENEAAIVEAAFREGYIQPTPPTRKAHPARVAIIGSGPAGLVAANRLNRAGHDVTVFDKEERPGGLLRYGIPNFKLGKNIIDRRVRLMEQEGIAFRMNTLVGSDTSARELLSTFDAVCIAIGSEVPRDLPTGSDCVGTANRQGALSVTQIEIMPKPPVGYNPETPWPQYPRVLKTSSSHEEGCTRRWCLTTNRFLGERGRLTGVEVEAVEWTTPTAGSRPEMHRTGKVETLDADLVFLAMGFVHPEPDGLVKELSLPLDERGNIRVNPATRQVEGCPKLFAAGDAVSGASLVVRAMASGRQAAEAIDAYLQK